jgi:hypothetical protein
MSKIRPNFFSCLSHFDSPFWMKGLPIKGLNKTQAPSFLAGDNLKFLNLTNLFFSRRGKSKI